MKRTMIIAVAIVVLVFGMVAYAGADTVAATSPVSNGVVINASNPARIELTVPDSVSMTSDMVPETSQTVSYALSGKSNRAADLTVAVTPGTFDSMSHAFGTGSDGLTDVFGGSLDWTGEVTAQVLWTNQNDAPSGTVTYTFTQ